MSIDPKSEESHRSRIEHYAVKVQQLYDFVVSEFTAIYKTIENSSNEKVFSFSDYPKVNERINKVLQVYADSLRALIIKGSTEEWYEASKKVDTKSTGVNVYNARNKEALLAFQNRVDAGLTLSQRVWNITKQSQQEVELALSSGINSGKSAKELSREVRKNLKEPDKLFRRVRDEFGVLQLSKKALAYSPGQGVYRSSYKNALRLTRTEINMAYRASDHFRWNNDPSVIGFEIKLSNRHKVRDICDDLKGKYPKGFLFRGWHPQCLCYKVPLLMSDDDFDVLQQSILDGTDIPVGFEPSNKVYNLPDNFTKWVKNNKEKSKSWKNTPFFVSDNFEGGKLSSGIKNNIIEVKKELSKDSTVSKQKFKLTSDLAKKLSLERSITFNGDVDNFNKILEGFDILEFDKEISNLFEKNGINISEKAYRIESSKVNFSYSGKGMYLERTFYLKDGLKNVSHDYFKIPENIQGGGISKQLFQSLYKQYQNAGIEILNVHANINIGGYTWAKYGFGTENNSFAYNRAKEKLTDNELLKFEKLLNFYGKKKSFLNKLSNTSFGKKVLLNSDWFGNVDLRKIRERKSFEKYLFGK